MNSANVKLFVFSESETQVVNIMLLGRLVSPFYLCRRMTFYLQELFTLYHQATAICCSYIIQYQQHQ